MWPLRRKTDLPAPDPGGLVYVIADIHGCFDQLTDLLERIERDANGVAHRIVALGDYIDRGPQSAQILSVLQDIGDDVTTLMGNHERMLLDFLAAPTENAARWLSYGGDQTVRSFGVSILLPPTEMAQALREAMGVSLLHWIETLPLWWRAGNLVACHAQTDPLCAMETQPEETLLWARPPHRITPRKDGAWVIHGHTVVAEPTMRHGQIAIDLGAYRGNPLVAAAFEHGNVRFLASPPLDGMPRQ